MWHSGGKQAAEEDAGFDIHQLCVRKHEMEERDEPWMLFSSLPGGVIKVGVPEFLPDLFQDGYWSNRLCLLQSGVGQQCNFTVLHGPDEGARVSLGGEDFGILDAWVVDTELGGLDADLENETRPA